MGIHPETARLRITADPEFALRNEDARVIWDGEVVVPVRPDPTGLRRRR
ncbi:MAG: hypothetical protein AB8G96_11715 [Phycisphaerales bacterium]